MKILALEFSASQRTVAVVNDGAVFESIESGSFSRGISLIDDALRAARIEREQIDTVAVGLGPGSYTGIRAAISIAQGWQLARDVKLLGVSSADNIAANVSSSESSGNINVVIDAQRGELYLAGYKLSSNGFHATTPLRIVPLHEARAMEAAGESFVGPEASRWFPSGRIVIPRAATLAMLAAARTDFVAGEKLEPIYLRETTFVKAPPPRNFDK